MANHRIILTLSLLLLATLPPSPAWGIRIAPTSDSFIRTSCSKATYPDLCITSLSSRASTILNSPTHLADAALSVSLSGARNTSHALSKLCHKTRKEPRVYEAMQDCVENVGQSISELRQSIREMGHLRGGDLKLKMDDVETWVSAALTEEETCMDGFEGKGTDGKVKMEVRACIVKVAELTSNALSFVNRLSQP